MHSNLQLVALCGGIGGAKLVHGLAQFTDRVDLTVIGNIGDDAEFHGLWVSPDIDIVTYTLAGCVDTEKGWGLADESFNALAMLGDLGSETWMTLGDRDLGVHIYRTMARKRGDTATEIAKHISKQLGVGAAILPASDRAVPTMINTVDGWLGLEEYFVRERCRPTPLAVEYRNAGEATATPDVLAALECADLIVIAPSNPILSVGPILAIPGITERIRDSKAHKVAVSPLIGGKAIKGPTEVFLKAMQIECSNEGISRFYQDLIDELIIDRADAKNAPPTKCEWRVADTLMTCMEEKVRLAGQVLRAVLNDTRRAINE